MADKEAEITKAIPNTTVSQYFYYMFVFVSIWVAIVVVYDIYLITSKPRIGVGFLFRTLPTLILAVANALFMYVLSARALSK